VFSRRFSTALIAALLVGAGTPAARADDWTSLGFEGKRWRLSLERSGGSFAAGWQRIVENDPSLPANQALFSSPAVADGVLVFATQRNQVGALRESDGTWLWRLATGGMVYSSPAIWRGMVFVVGVSSDLQARNVADGRLLWHRGLEAITYSSPVVVDGAVYVATGHPTPRVWRLDALTGAVTWVVGQGILRQAALASLAVVNGRVLVAETGGRVHSFAASNGAWQWGADTAGSVHFSSPLVMGQRVYLLPGGAEGKLHALDLGTASRIPGWPIDLPGLPHPRPAARLMRRQHVVSSPAGIEGTITFALRIDEELDTNDDYVADLFVSRERVMAVDPAIARVAWVVDNGSVSSNDQSRIPTHGLLPTPAVYRTEAGEPLLAVASSLAPRLRVLELRTGREAWSTALPAATRGSPLLANGRLVVATDDGTVHSFLSTVNQAPSAPRPSYPYGGLSVDAPTATVRWTAASDRERNLATYVVRLDDDGEVMHDYDVELLIPASQLTADVSQRVVPGQLYTYAVRARDSHGALSAWSPAETFRAVGELPTRRAGIDALTGTGGDGLSGGGQRGDHRVLGPGVFRLSEVLRLGAGASLIGAGPHLTRIDATGQQVGLLIDGSGVEVQQLTVSGAEIGIQVTGARDVKISNVIVEENAAIGIEVKSDASATVVNSTIEENGTGVVVAGPTQVRNTLVTRNKIGLTAAGAALLTARYNAVQRNRVHDYDNADAGILGRGDRAGFKDGVPTGLSLAAPQPVVDRGDPADDFSQEPQPNGGRINIGAFGNTPFADVTESEETPPLEPEGEDPTDEPAGMSCAVDRGAAPASGPGLTSALAAALVLALARRRRRRPSR
jgi:outer membrane protein assembly factor BamB